MTEARLVLLSLSSGSVIVNLAVLDAKNSPIAVADVVEKLHEQLADPTSRLRTGPLGAGLDPNFMIVRALTPEEEKTVRRVRYRVACALRARTLG